MSTEIMGGPVKWESSTDEDGNRTYTLTLQTLGGLLDGPAAHEQTPGLPQPGSIWAIGNDLDVYAWCTGATKRSMRESKGSIFFDHTFTYTTKARGGGSRPGKKDDRGARKRCADQRIEDPLAEPPKTSGGSIRATEAYAFDLYGNRIRTTSFEQITGPQVEFDRSRRQVIVELNDINLDLAQLDPLVDTVNDRTLWDLPARCWKLSEFHWDRKLYGSCFFYYAKRFVFESNVSVAPIDLIYVDRSTGNSTTITAGTTYSRWDHFIPDDSSRALKGRWNKTLRTWVLDAQNLDYRNPNHYDTIPSLGNSGGNIRRVLSRTNRGQPAAENNENDMLIWRIQVYPETDFLAKIPRLPAQL